MAKINGWYMIEKKSTNNPFFLRSLLYAKGSVEDNFEYMCWKCWEIKCFFILISLFIHGENKSFCALIDEGSILKELFAFNMLKCEENLMIKWTLNLKFLFKKQLQHHWKHAAGFEQMNQITYPNYATALN